MAKHSGTGWAVTLVGANDLPIGLYAADGSIRVTQDIGLGVYAPNGSMRIADSGSSAYSPNGAMNGTLSGNIFTPRGMGSGGVAPPVGVVFLDDFNRADDTALATGNPQWTATGGITTAARVTSNQLSLLASEGSFITPDLSSANHAIQFLVVSGGAVGPFIAVRAVDNNNFIGIRFNVSTNAVQVWTRVASTLAQIGGTTFGTLIGSVLRVEVLGDQVQVLRDGVVAIPPITLSGVGAGIKTAGVISRTVTAVWDNCRAENITAFS